MIFKVNRSVKKCISGKQDFIATLRFYIYIKVYERQRQNSTDPLTLRYFWVRPDIWTSMLFSTLSNFGKS